MSRLKGKPGGQRAAPGGQRAAADEEEAPEEVIIAGNTYGLGYDGYYHLVTEEIHQVMRRGTLVPRTRKTLSIQAYRYKNGHLYAIIPPHTHLRLREAEESKEEAAESKEEAAESKEEAEESKEWRHQFNRVMRTIQNDASIQDQLRQLSESSDDVNLDDLPIAMALPMAEALLMQHDVDMPIAFPVEENNFQENNFQESKDDPQTVEIPEDEPVLGQTPDGTVLIFKNATKAFIHGAVVLGTVTKETLELLGPLVQVAGVVAIKTKDGLVIAAKIGGKIAMGILKELQEQTGPKSETATVIQTVVGLGVTAGKEVWRLTGTFFEYVFSADGGDGDDPNRYDSSSSEELSPEDEEERPVHRPRRHQRAAAPTSRPTNRRQARQLRKLDNHGGGRLYTTRLGESGQAEQTDEERNRAQRAARIARTKRRGRRLYEPQLKQFV